MQKLYIDLIYYFLTIRMVSLRWASQTPIPHLRTIPSASAACARLPLTLHTSPTFLGTDVIKLFVVLLVVAGLSGCATKEGIALPTSKPTQDDVGDFNRRNMPSPNAATPTASVSKDAVKTSLIPDVQGPRLIIVGNAMALTVFNETALNQRYDNYLKQIGAKTPAFAREWYLATGSGETSVKFSGVTGIYTRFYKTEIPKDLIRQIGFASSFGTFMAGTSADLVVSQVLPGYGTWITHVLCSEKDPNYAACEDQYRRGLYQSADGREVDTTLKLVEGGGIIDPLTFKKPVRVGSSNDQVPIKPALGQPMPAPASAAAPLASAPSPAQPSSANPTLQRDEAAQLQKLKELLDRGLITQEEYERKRKEILDRL